MKLQLTTEGSRQRLDNALKNAFGEYSRGQLQKAIKAGLCLVDDSVETDPARKLRPNQKIDLELPEESNKLEPSDNDLQIIWRDEHIAVIVKPAGLTTHPCPSCQEETLVNRLLAHFPELASQDGERPGIVHRLDKDTSGLMLIALTEQARQALAVAFANRRVHKRYMALAFGDAPEKGQCHEPIGRHPTLKTRMACVSPNHGGREAITEWRKLKQCGNASLLDVAIMTGRTHQIRVHLAKIGWPLVGDKLYAPAAVANLAQRQMLHAWRIKFNHPVTGEEMEFHTPPPADFLDAALGNGKYMQRVVVTGNQGSGKSSFCKSLAEAGVPTVSADAIVAKMYSGKSEATEWIEAHMGAEAIRADGAVDKPALFQIMQNKPWLRKELEKAIHGLVLKAIEEFWEGEEKAGKDIACAEIPLYFESGYAEIIKPKPYVIGISSPESKRWGRLAKDRHWSLEKIKEMESWQWPDKRKMAACDEVIENEGSPEELANAARLFLERFKDRMASLESEKRRKLENMCGYSR